MTGFKDYFSGHSQAYGQFRPSYPEKLFTWLASTAPARNLAWDCATGNGQAARSLAAHFTRVVASDGSEMQIRQAAAHEKITYRVALAEASALPTASVDLITVAQAVHWFDLEKFSQEVRRTLAAGGVAAVWSYGLLSIDPEIDQVIGHFYGETLAPYWPAERKIIENHYRDIVLPMKAIASPAFDMQTQWNLSQLIGYLQTWSAVKACERSSGTDPTRSLAESLADLWGEPESVKTVTWPLILKAWQK